MTINGIPYIITTSVDGINITTYTQVEEYVTLLVSNNIVNIILVL